VPDHAATPVSVIPAELAGFARRSRARLAGTTAQKMVENVGIAPTAARLQGGPVP